MVSYGYVKQVPGCRFMVQSRRSLNTSDRCDQTATRPVAETDAKVKCTLIPGDGVGPELCAATREVLSAMQVPIEFEELFLRSVDSGV